MDRICVAVLNKINTLSPAGRYIIVSGSELCEAFPDNAERSFEELKRALNNLCRSGYIDLKYSRGDMYCVAPLKEYTEDIIPTVQPNAKRLRIDPVFISSFAGGALGSLIISLIFAFL